MKSESGKKQIRLKSVNTSVWGYFCLLSALLILLVELIFYMVVTSSYEDRARKIITRIGTEVEAKLADTDTINESILKYSEYGVYVYILSAEGEVIAPAGSEEINGNTFAELKKRLENGSDGASITYRSGDSLNLAKKTANGGGSYILVTYSLTIMRDTLKTMQLYFILVGVTVFAATCLLSYLLSKRLTRGFKNMSDTAVRLAKGDYSVQFTNADYKEMAQLSDTLNYVRDEVKKSEDFRHEILANVTHDLKTPLTMIKAYASMIKEISGDNPEKRDKHLQVIIDESDRLTGLVNDVLSVSKLSANMEAISPKVLNLTELVYGIINKFGYLQESMGYTLMVDIDPNLYTRADGEKISQVVYNLLGNAANYTGEDKTVYISLKSSMDGKRIKFSVRDTGKGISKEDLPEIWNRYYRVNENHVRPVKGTGLGLNIVKVILQNHAFDFGVESSKGCGSTFWVDFPQIPADIQVDDLQNN